MPFEVKVKLLKEMYHVQVDPDESPSKFAEAVEAECGVPPGKKLICQIFSTLSNHWAL